MNIKKVDDKPMVIHTKENYADGLLNERDYLFTKQKYVKEAENLTQKLSELAAMQTTYGAELR